MAFEATSEVWAARKAVLMDTIADDAARLLYYSRKDDEELRPEMIEAMLRAKVVTVDEMVEQFRRKLTEYLGDAGVSLPA